MNVLLTILLVIIGIIALLLIFALFMKKNHYVQREIIINAPLQNVFDFLKLIENQEKFNRHAMTEPDRKKEYKGTDGTVGYIYSWSGNKSAGVGEKEIKNIVEGKSIETEIRFVKPMAVSSTVIMEMEALTADQTKVYWSNAGILNYPLNIMIPMLEKSLPKDMDKSLINLKEILEK
jgi:hypothetical protein